MNDFIDTAPTAEDEPTGATPEEVGQKAVEATEAAQVAEPTPPSNASVLLSEAAKFAGATDSSVSPGMAGAIARQVDAVQEPSPRSVLEPVQSNPDMSAAPEVGDPSQDNKPE